MRSELYNGWLPFNGSLEKWIAEQAKIGRKFLTARRRTQQTGVDHLLCSYAYPRDSHQEVAVEYSPRIPLVFYDPEFSCPGRTRRCALPCPQQSKIEASFSEP